MKNNVLKYNVGLIGYGYWGKNILRNLLESEFVQNITVADINNSILERLRDTHVDITTTDNATSVINDKDIHAIFVATPSSLHFKLSKEAMLSGKHVFVEKPLVTELSHALELRQICDELGLVISVDHTFLYNDAVRKIKSLISTGQLGKVNYIDSTRINLGIYQEDVNVMWDLAAHDISMINYWIEERPNTIRAVGKVNDQHEILDLAYIFLNYPSGLLVQINCSWASPVKIRKTIIGGSQRMVIYDDVEPTDKLKIYDYSNTEECESDRQRVLVDYRLGDVTIPKLSLQEPLKQAISDFFHCIESGREPVSGVQSGIEVVHILEKADLSLRQNGKPIPLD